MLVVLKNDGDPKDAEVSLVILDSNDIKQFDQMLKSDIGDVFQYLGVIE